MAYFLNLLRLSQHGIDCIVIEGDDGKVAGIVSERDLMRAIGQAGGSKVFSGGQCQAKRCTDF